MIYKNKVFARFANKNQLRDEDLVEAMRRAERGLIDADLGGDVVKLRIPRPNEGRSGGFRTIVIVRHGAHAFFVYGFAKNERDNISASELAVFRDYAKVLLALDEAHFQATVDRGALTPVRER